MEWSKFLSREFLISLALIAIATIGLFKGVATFIEWTAACGGFCAVWMGALTVQKIKVDQ